MYLIFKIALVLTVANAFPREKLHTHRSELNDFTYYPRAEWGAATSNDTRVLNTPVPYVVIHHTYIPAACHSFGECSEAMRSMQRYHSSLGWGDIGYNFCVGNEGDAYEGRGWRVIGIHAGQANSISIGICLIGDWRTDHPPNKMLDTTKSLIDQGVELGVISKDYKLIGHRQAMDTECPGNALYDEIKTWDHFSPAGVNKITVKKDSNGLMLTY